MSPSTPDQAHASSAAANDSTAGGNVDEGSKSPKRRKKTAAEKEAHELRRLQRKFGDTVIDGSEPQLPIGFPRNALACAFNLARTVMMSARRKRFDPERIAEQTIGICRQAAPYRADLVVWLEWLKPRRFVATDPYSSPALLWALSKSSVSADWDGDPFDIWASAVDAEHDRRKAVKTVKTSEPTGTGSSATTGASGQGSSVSDTRPTGVGSNGYPFGGSEIADTTTSSTATRALHRPKFPNPAFREGEILANAFFRALRDGPDDVLIAKAKDLAKNHTALSAALNRNAEVRRCIENIFKQIGLPLPEANS